MIKQTMLISLLHILSFCVFTVDNLIYSVFLVILIFLSSSFILFVMKVDFLGFVFIIIYVGAIAVLFLFVIMMINIKSAENVSIKSFKFFIVICSCCSIFFNQWFFFYALDVLNWDISVSRIFDCYANIFLVSHLLYSFHAFSFLIAGLILLISMLGAILLTMNFKLNSFSQLVSKQGSQMCYAFYSCFCFIAEK